MNQYIEAMSAVREAIDKVRDIDVHGRDYYPISDSAASVAMAEHRTRIISLESVRVELEAVALFLSEEIGKREDRGSKS